MVSSSMAWHRLGLVVDEFVELVESGFSVHQVAGRLGIDYASALVVAKELGLKVRTGKGTKDPVVRQEFVRRVCSGKQSINAIAVDLGISVSAAYRLATRLGVFIPAPGAGITAQSTTRRVEYLRLRQVLSRKDAAVACAIHIKTASDWDKGVTKHDGGRVCFIPAGKDVVDYNILMAMMVERSGDLTARNHPHPNPVSVEVVDRVISDRYLSVVQREIIADMCRAGHTNAEIARAIGVHRATVGRELRRNSPARGAYGASQAQRQSAARRARPKKAKLVANPRLLKYVLDGFAQQWSPEQIAGRVRLDHPDDERMRVCAETIYDAFYLDAKGGLGRLTGVSLPSGRRKRKPRKVVGSRPKRFVDEMVMIDDRPEVWDDRMVPGCWEGDLILGKNNASAVGTLVERTTLFTTLVHIPGRHTAENVCDRLIDAVKDLERRVASSIAWDGSFMQALTWDQGSEMAEHARFSMATNVDVYFAHPASPWERGLNENTNGRIRRFLPKGEDLSRYSALDLEVIANTLNNTPRKALGFKKPIEVVQELLAPQG